MFSKKYPNITWWIEEIGTIELGTDEYTSSLLRVLNEGGTVWEDEDSTSIEEALAAADAFIEANYD